MGRLNARREGHSGLKPHSFSNPTANNRLVKNRRKNSPFSIKQGNSCNLKPQIIKQTFQMLRNLYQWKQEEA